MLRGFEGLCVYSLGAEHESLGFRAESLGSSLSVGFGNQGHGRRYGMKSVRNKALGLRRFVSSLMYGFGMHVRV